MDAIESPLKLQDDDGTQETIYNSTTTIGGKYNKATMIKGGLATRWFVYSAKNWGENNNGNCVVVAEDETTAAAPWPIQSARGYNKVNRGLVIFQDTSYRGPATLIEHDSPDLTAYPPGKAGVSAIYVTGGVWNLYSGYNYTGALLALNGQSDFGPGVYTFGGSSISNRALSARCKRCT